MRRTSAVLWHALFSAFAAILYFLFVIPRWWELIGLTPHVLGTVLRIVTAALIGLAALPVVFTLLRTRKPEYGTPQLALRLLVASIAAHVLAGVLIAGTAISEIWLSLDKAGPWLFGIYGAAAAIALLGIGAYYLSFVAEMPPPPPKPLKPKEPKKVRQRRRDRKKAKGAAEGTEGAADGAAEAPEGAEEGAEEGAGEAVEESAETGAEETGAEETGAAEAEAPDVDLVSSGSRHKRRPSGKRRTKNS